MKNKIRLVSKAEEDKTVFYLHNMDKETREHINKIVEKLRAIADEHGITIKKQII
jgi:hypothetical protein